MLVCESCLLPLDGDEREDDGAEALTVQLGVICPRCAGAAAATVADEPRAA